MRPLDSVKQVCGLELRHFETLGSTNDYAKELRDEVDCIVTTDRQTAGRGQRGNRWESAAGENLTFSLVIHPGRSVGAGDQFRLSEITSLAVHETLADCGLSSAIKWPNDIYIGDKKVCGMLLEHDIAGAYVWRSVIGVGINVNQREFASDAPNPVSMALAAGKGFDRVEVLERFCKNFIALSGLEPAELEQNYLARLYRKEGFHPYATPSGERFEAKISRLSEYGELILEERDGRKRSFAFKEVEYVMDRG